MLRIRLSRAGKRNSAMYSVVVSEREFRRDGNFIEKVGYFNPSKKNRSFVAQWDRIDHWIKSGAIPSDTVKALIKKHRA